MSPSRPSRRGPYSLTALEPRRLLSGVTLIADGFESSSDTPDWMFHMSASVMQRAGGDNASAYMIGFDDNGSPQLLNLLNSSPETSPVDEIVVLLDWSKFSDPATFPDVNTGLVASVVTPFFTQTFPSLGINHPLAELPLHLIGHSRGGSLITELAERLGEIGIWVDQVTTLDPHPIQSPGQINAPDPDPTLYQNVIFADNYYETAYPIGGSPIDGALNVGPLSLGSAHSSLDGGAHADVHSWYQGTITDSPTDGEITIPSSWYDNPGQGPRSSTGFAYSRISGATRPSAGIAGTFGGDGARTALPTATSPQWPNITSLTLNQPGADFLVGQALTANFLFQDADSSSSVTLFLDNDLNPYNSGTYYTIAQGPQYAPNSQVLQQSDISLSTNSVAAAGQYYILARITDGPHSRYTYAPYPINLIAPPTVSLQGASQSESNPSLTFNVTLSHASPTSLSMRYSTVDDSATAGSDFSFTTGILTFDPGQTSKTVTIPINFDASIENDERFYLKLLAMDDPDVVFVQAPAFILNDDFPNVSISATNVTEGGAVDFTVTLSAPAPFPLSLHYFTADNTATSSADYTPLFGDVTFTAGQTTKTFSVVTTPDPTIENDESFFFRLAPANDPANPIVQAAATIANDDFPNISILPTTVNEGATATITAKLSAAAPFPISVQYGTRDGTAISGQHYSSSAGTITFAPNTTSATFSVTTIHDNTFTPDLQAIVEIWVPAGATREGASGVASALLTIANTDPAPPPPAPGPDLTASIISTPSLLLPGGKKNLAVARISNAGNRSVKGPVEIRLYASTNTTFDDDYLLATSAQKLNHPPGKSTNVTLRFNSPVNVPAGPYHLLVVIDPGQHVAEQYETNNVGATNNITNITAPTNDPKLTKATFPAKLRHKGRNTATVYVLNTGNFPAAGQYTLKLYLSPSNTNPAGATFLATLSKRLTLKPNQQSPLKLSFSLPSSAQPGQYLYATLDFTSPVPDQDLTNDTLFSNMPVVIA